MGQAESEAGIRNQAIADQARMNSQEYLDEQARLRRQKLLDESRAEREKDFAAGRARGQELFSTPIVQESAVERSGSMADIIKRRRDALQGYAAPEQNALREQAMVGINKSAGQDIRKLRGVQGAAGVRGATAGAQVAGVLKNRGQAAANVERDLFIQNISERQAALDRLEKSISGAEAVETSRLGNRKFGQLSTELGYGILGSGERSAVAQQLIGEEQAKAAAANANRGGKK